MIEALNDERRALSLAPVFVAELDGSRPSIMATLAVDKSQIKALVIRGTDALYRRSDGPMTSAPDRAVVVLSVPPFMAQGEIDWRFARAIGRLRKAEASDGRLSSLPRFFELTDGWLFMSLSPVASHASLLLNRDHVMEAHVLGQDSASEGDLPNLFSRAR